MEHFILTFFKPKPACTKLLVVVNMCIMIGLLKRVIASPITLKLEVYPFRHSLVISTYNRGKEVLKLVQNINSNMRHNVEIIVVDDASDQQHQAALEQIKNISRVKVIKHKTNLGPFHAKLHGFQAAKGQYILSIDDDDSCDPGYHNEIIENIDPFYDFISIKNHPFSRYFTITPNITQWIESYHNHVFMAFRRSLIDNVEWPPDNYRIRRDDAALMIPLYFQSNSNKIKLINNSHKYIIRRSIGSQMSTYANKKNMQDVKNGRDFVVNEAKRLGIYPKMKPIINSCWKRMVDPL